MIIFIILVLISSAIFFALLEQKKGQQEKNRQRNDWNEQERQRIEQQQKEVQEADRYYERQQKERQEVEEYIQREKELQKDIDNSIMNSLAIEDFCCGGINLIPLKRRGDRDIECIFVKYYVSSSYDKKEKVIIGIARNHDGVYNYTTCIRIPAKDEYYALNKIAKIIIKYHTDIGNKIVYLDSIARKIEDLKKFISSTEYGQPDGLFPENSSQIYTLNDSYKDLHQRYNLLIFNVMKGNALIGYDSTNFPDISVTVATLESEHDDLTNQFKCLNKHLDTYPKLKIDLKSLGYYEGRYEY
jgi:hypothetical protein